MTDKMDETLERQRLLAESELQYSVILMKAYYGHQGFSDDQAYRKACGYVADLAQKWLREARTGKEAELGKAFRELAAALELFEPAAVGEVGDGEELARRLAESYRLRPVETLAALGPLMNLFLYTD